MPLKYHSSPSPKVHFILPLSLLESTTHNCILIPSPAPSSYSPAARSAKQMGWMAPEQLPQLLCLHQALKIAHIG